MKILMLILFFIIATSGEESEIEGNKLKLCEVCVCSEIPLNPDFDKTHLVLNIQCSELDKIDSVADLDKIEWPENRNNLKIVAAFEGLGLSTLGKLPPNPQVETLRFTNNAIKTYWPDPFSDVPSLKTLSFNQNDLTEVTPDLFTKIHQLEDLDLSYNKLTEFSSLDFKHLREVRKLNLQSNLLKRVPIEALQPMRSLEDLDLSKNGIYDLLLQRGDSGVLKSLKRLNLSGNRIRSVMKDAFPAGNNIEFLDLSNNIIEIVEEDAFLNCGNLTELNLMQNNITLIFALPPKLQVVLLKMNTLHHWPKFPDTITYVDLSYNKLTDLYDESAVNFDKLEILNIAGNQIKELNIEKRLPKLFVLDISYNFLTEIPKSINNQLLPNLEDLNLDGNPIESIYFKNIIVLKRLHMSELSKIEVVEDKAFSNVIGRPMHNETDVCFSLFLSKCPLLKEIKDGAFSGTDLCMLDISQNSLTHISQSLLDWSRLSAGADLQLNPWHCGCGLQWLLDDLLPRMYADNSRLLSDLRCGSPRAYKGLRLVHFYNWTEKAMCGDDFARSPPRDYMLEPSTKEGPRVTSLTLILGGCIIVTLLVAIALTIYLVRSRRRYRVRQAALNRKRQSALDSRNTNGSQKEQFSALNQA